MESFAIPVSRARGTGAPVFGSDADFACQTRAECHNTSLIQVRALTKSIDTGSHRVDILKGIDLEIPTGQFAAIMGPSGSGKSTLLGLIAGLDSPTSGQVLLDGQDITRLSEDEMALLRGRKIGFVFQSYHLIPTLTAEENVLLPMELAGQDGGGLARARELLDRVGVRGRHDHYPVQLSGGEQQRVALARAFALRPSILLADEPTGNLDTATGRAVLELLLAQNREQGATLVLVTHEESLANSADRRIVLRDGLVVSQ
jgi:putative ABC transport system ATP-binding protein